MKKTFLLLTFIFILLIISSCATKTSDEKGSDVKMPSWENEAVTSEPSTDENEKVTPNIPREKIEYNYSVTARDFDSIQALSHEERAKEFISALCLKDTEIVNQYIGGRINALDSVKKIQITKEGIINGRIILFILCKPVAPSMLAASNTSVDNPVNPAM